MAEAHEALAGRRAELAASRSGLEARTMIAAGPLYAERERLMGLQAELQVGEGGGEGRQGSAARAPVACELPIACLPSLSDSDPVECTQSEHTHTHK